MPLLIVRALVGFFLIVSGIVISLGFSLLFYRHTENSCGVTTLAFKHSNIYIKDGGALVDAALCVFAIVEWEWAETKAKEPREIKWVVEAKSKFSI